MLLAFNSIRNEHGPLDAQVNKKLCSQRQEGKRCGNYPDKTRPEKIHRKNIVCPNNRFYFAGSKLFPIRF